MKGIEFQTFPAPYGALANDYLNKELISAIQRHERIYDCKRTIKPLKLDSINVLEKNVKGLMNRVQNVSEFKVSLL